MESAGVKPKCSFCQEKEAKYRCDHHGGSIVCGRRCVESQCLVDSLSSLPSNEGTQSRLRRLGLQAQNVQWEDVGRSKGSVWGPNISGCNSPLLLTDFFLHRHDPLLLWQGHARHPSPQL